MMKALAFLVVALTTAAGCSHDDHHEEGEASGAVCAPAENLTYETFGRAFMESYCVRCHSSKLTGAARNGATVDHDFDTFIGVFNVAEHIDENAAAGPDAVNTAMPPDGPKPTLEERQKLGKWLACVVADAADGGLPDGI
jgi:hypothetical protein